MPLMPDDEANTWPDDTIMITAASQSSATLHAFDAALAQHGYTYDDARMLLAAIVDGTYRAVLCSFENGETFWLIERPDVFPPQNWTLASFLSRLHSAPCGKCHHQSEDLHMDCICACHTIFAGILNFEG